MTDERQLDYARAGVDIDAGTALVERIKPAVARTARPGLLGGLGGFGALFEIPLDRYRQPVLVSGTDGVGTKLKLATTLGRHDTIGIDLVAMCVNDIVVSGAEPLYFLDYYATGRLDVETAATVVEGIARGCELAGCALAGGETAEMPGMYADGDYDLAGFAVGIVDRDRMILPDRVRPGDIVLGLAASGPHANGYSLIRKVIEVAGTDLDADLDGRPLAARLLEPTRIYVRALLRLAGQIEIHALAHVTGGGLTENLPRVLPAATDAHIDLAAWRRPAVFDWLQEAGGIARDEMLRTFNCGIGMVVCVAPGDEALATRVLAESGEDVTRIGTIVASSDSTPRVHYV